MLRMKMIPDKGFIFPLGHPVPISIVNQPNGWNCHHTYIVGPQSIFLQILISSWIGGYNTDESSAWDHQHHAIHNLHITQHPSPLSTSLQPSYYYYDQPGIIAMKILTSSVINKSAKKEQTWDDCHENSYIKCYHQISKKEENLGWGQLCSPNSSGPSG